MRKNVTILGLPFFNGGVQEALERVADGGLMVAPSGPGLAWDLMTNSAYRSAVTTADVAIMDSGIMVLLWNSMNLLSKRNRIERLSGLKFLDVLLMQSALRSAGQSLWLMPSKEDMEINLEWLRRNGFDHLDSDDCVVAPVYKRAPDGGIEDKVLLQRIEERRPAWVILNVGSGVQEPLGHWLREHLSYRPAIICTGAAIGFLSGIQANIPSWADRFYLGWLLRILHNPRRFFPRYARALRLVPLLLRWRQMLPPLLPRTPSGRTDAMAGVHGGH